VPERVELRPRYRLPLCPVCGATMELMRVLPAGGYTAEQLIFRCRRCELVVTEPGERRAG